MPSSKSATTRLERDCLGELEVPAEAYWGIHTLRATRNFPFSGYRLHSGFIRALALVKQACAETNTELSYLSKDRGSAIVGACQEMEQGLLDQEVVVDPFQGGAGTSTNMNINEVIAGRASELMGGKRGDRSLVHPLDHVNMHQSTNDVYPTALKLAVLSFLSQLEQEIADLQTVLQAKEQEFRDIVKVSRTELNDAVPMTLGMTFGAWAEAVARDRWRVFKCRERIKKVNLGGTAIGTGLGAPQEYILRVVTRLRHLSGQPVSRAENMVDATQNMDSFVEISGILKAQATNLVKIASDIRLLSSGPATGIGEIKLAPLQAGSSIMAGKINPVMLEAVTQAALRVMGNDQTVTLAASLGQLELNHLLPLLTHCLLESLILLKNACQGLTKNCILDIRPDTKKCKNHVEQSTALATVLVPAVGYEKVEALLTQARLSGRTVREEAEYQKLASPDVLDALLSPRRLCKLGYSDDDYCGIAKK